MLQNVFDTGEHLEVNKISSFFEQRGLIYGVGVFSM